MNGYMYPCIYVCLDVSYNLHVKAKLYLLRLLQLFKH